MRASRVGIVKVQRTAHGNQHLVWSIGADNTTPLTVAVNGKLHGE
jgi:hypothetical protein